MNEQINYDRLNWHSESDLPTCFPIFDLQHLEVFDPNDDDGLSQQARSFIATVRNSGFFYLKGHGISDILITDLINTTNSFFLLPSETKRQYVCPYLPLRGYSGYCEESTATAIGYGTEPDHCEKYTWTWNNIYPNEHFQTIWSQYQSEVGNVCRRLLKIIGIALNVEETAVWQQVLDGRPMIRYLDYPEWSEASGNALERMAPHCDIGSITLLHQTPCENGAVCLEALVDNKFIGLPSIKGSFVVNLGETLAHLTNGFVKATKHRVIRSPEQGNSRTALAAFYMPNDKFDLHEFRGSRFQGHYLKDDMQYFHELIDEIAVTFCQKQQQSNDTIGGDRDAHVISIADLPKIPDFRIDMQGVNKEIQ
jgi:deacetoxycephalosporin-C synthase/deacetoxycephalosporin-C hydroxylase